MVCGADYEVNLPCSEYRPVVLIAQSNKEDLNLILEACKKFDKFDVQIANTGQGVIDKVNSHCFDAIIIGLKFSDITGATIAYLVHKFDPLVSVAFLTVYDNDILISVAQDLGFKFWNKTDKMDNIEAFCNEIYDLAMAMPCDNQKRIIKREYMKPVREEYLRYGKLTVPDSILQVVEERKQKGNIKRNG